MFNKLWLWVYHYQAWTSKPIANKQDHISYNFLLYGWADWASVRQPPPPPPQIAWPSFAVHLTWKTSGSWRTDRLFLLFTHLGHLMLACLAIFFSCYLESLLLLIFRTPHLWSLFSMYCTIKDKALQLYLSPLMLISTDDLPVTFFLPRKPVFIFMCLC